MQLKFAFLLLFITIAFGLSSCTQATPPKPSVVQSGGACSEEYSRAYEKILNLPTGTVNTQAQCDEFYASYPGIKCFSIVDGSELRVHTNDFDLKCQKNISNKSKPPTSSKNSPSPANRDDKKPLCSNELIEFVLTKKSEFYAAIKTIENSDTTDESAFDLALASKKICNQYFFNYNYTECSRDTYAYSFHDLKKYCDEFQNVLHALKNKNPKKFSPQEMRPLTLANLKFTFKDSLIPFYSSKVKVKDAYLVDGMLVSFGDISSNQNYCYLESEKLRYSGELKSTLYKVDVTYPNRNRTVFTYTSFNEQWRMICHSRVQLNKQDLLEVAGDKITIFE
ncbi:MAG: hypothetical protein B7Y39_18050 [Bdellovibrio sp. 28-41-41]|nr:MAG: hypothetical protein B7Y39_18050 [Bdellovibrio sp. 28-41-41]